MQVPLLDLKAQYQTIKPEIDAAIQQVVESQYFIMGPAVAELETRVAQYCGCAHGIGISSGTDALLIALMALGIGANDEVIVPTYTFFATAGSVSRLSAKPVFVDMEPDTYNLNPGAIERSITARTKAIIPVHLFGQCADMDPIRSIARKHNLNVIEDAAQAIGAEYQGKKAGSMGNAGCFSFFPSKNLGGFGDGGMVLTNNADLAEKIRVLRSHGSKPKYHHKIVGGNFRLDTLQAAVLLVKLKYLDSWTAARQKNAKDYDALFQDAGLLPDRVRIPARKQTRHIFNQYVIRVERRDALQTYLKEKEVGAEIYYPVPLHLQECFAALGYKEGDCPAAEEAAGASLALPIYPELTLEQKQYVVNCIRTFYELPT
ncbi:MAG: DegT/DnrJ/EryC1/StrS family aminotransferase [Candidatus Omnitrophota bacterium]|nr:DegT/DnrJ/EryC1/StrS family aminotransferase [Candidatus Omnitrophota bacterium]